MRQSVVSYLQDHDTPMTLAVFLMLINPDAYKPKFGAKFNEWSWPKTEYEFDHCGGFIQMSNRLYVYSGGETKWSSTCICY